jgi:uncharacterized protein YceK
MVNKKLWLGMLVMVLVFGMTVVGCSTTVHSVEISNVSPNNIKETYIRNAGTTNWGSNVSKDLQNIDKSRFSATVDIRVVDTNGIVYEKYNVPFGDTAFELTGQTRSINMTAFGIVLLAAIIPFLFL